MVKFSPFIVTHLATLSCAAAHGYHNNQDHDHHEHHDHKHHQRGRALHKNRDRKGHQVNGPFIFNGIFYESSTAFVATGKNCGTSDLPPERRKEVEKEVKDFMGKRYGTQGLRHLQNQEIVVNTYIHVVYKNSSSDPSNVSTDAINKQMKVLNEAFEGLPMDYTDCDGIFRIGISTPFRFNLVSVSRTLNNSWHNSLDDNAMIGALRKGTCSDLNVFINSAGGGLGYASIASSCSNTNLVKDKVSINWETLPDISTGPYAQGDTLPHEVGHWLGLEHTFEGGCSSTGDFVSDTAPEAFGGPGCPVGRDTCPGGGVDPITNYMDYTDDCCMFTFTSGQSTRMVEQSITYRALDYAPVPVPVPAPVPVPVPVTVPTVSQCPSGQIKTEVILNLDEYADETSWRIIRASDSAEVARFQGVSSQSGTTVSNSFCLGSSAMYFLILSDSYGDGMPGNYYNPGSWTLKVNGVIKASGNGDSFAYNQAVTFGTPIKCPGTSKSFVLLLQTDGFGEETSWLINNGLTTVASSAVIYEGNTVYVEKRCLSAGLSLYFSIKDEYLDGICCAYGAGFYNIYLGGSLLKSGDQFEADEDTYFST